MEGGGFDALFRRICSPTSSRVAARKSSFRSRRKTASRRYAALCGKSERILEEAESRRKAAKGRPMAVSEVKTKQTNRLVRRPFYEFSRQELEGIVQRWYAKAKPEAIETAQFLFNLRGPEDRADELRRLEKQLESLERRSPTADDIDLLSQIRVMIEEAGGCITAVRPAGFTDTHVWLMSTVREAMLSINRACSSVLETGILPAVEKPMQIVQQSPVMIAATVPSVTLEELIQQFDSDPKNQDWEPKTRDEFKLIYDLLRECIGCCDSEKAGEGHERPLYPDASQDLDETIDFAQL